MAPSPDEEEKQLDHDSIKEQQRSLMQRVDALTLSMNSFKLTADKSMNGDLLSFSSTSPPECMTKTSANRKTVTNTPILGTQTLKVTNSSEATHSTKASANRKTVSNPRLLGTQTPVLTNSSEATHSTKASANRKTVSNPWLLGTQTPAVLTNSSQTTHSTKASANRKTVSNPRLLGTQTPELTNSSEATHSTKASANRKTVSNPRLLGTQTPELTNSSEATHSTKTSANRKTVTNTPILGTQTLKVTNSSEATHSTKTSANRTTLINAPTPWTEADGDNCNVTSNTNPEEYEPTISNTTGTSMSTGTTKDGHKTSKMSTGEKLSNLDGVMDAKMMDKAGMMERNVMPAAQGNSPKCCNHRQIHAAPKSCPHSATHQGRTPANGKVCGTCRPGQCKNPMMCIKPHNLDITNVKSADYYFQLVNYQHDEKDQAMTNDKSRPGKDTHCNSRLLSVVHTKELPHPKIYLFKFHASMSQSTIDGRQTTTTACAIISMYFAQKFIKNPTIFPTESPIRTLPEKIFRQVETAIREGNGAHEANYKGETVNLGPEEVCLLTTHLGFEQLYETDIDTREPETFVSALMNLAGNQAIMLIKNSRVVSMVTCNQNHGLLLFDSHPHFVITSSVRKVYGAYLFYAQKEYVVLKDLIMFYDNFCDPTPFYGKMVVFNK